MNPNTAYLGVFWCFGFPVTCLGRKKSIKGIYFRCVISISADYSQRIWRIASQWPMKQYHLSCVIDVIIYHIGKFPKYPSVSLSSRGTFDFRVTVRNFCLGYCRWSAYWVHGLPYPISPLGTVDNLLIDFTVVTGQLNTIDSIPSPYPIMCLNLHSYWAPMVLPSTVSTIMWLSRSCWGSSAESTPKHDRRPTSAISNQSTLNKNFIVITRE